MNKKLKYYFTASYRRKILDKLQEENKDYFKGVVFDIGGRDRGCFKKPKKKVDKWIFADIVKSHNPDILLDVTDMKKIKNDSIDTIGAFELFEHVNKIEKGLSECKRVLKKDGYLLISIPFLHPIHADPCDFQRWTIYKWKYKLKKLNFEIEKIEIMGMYFTNIAENIKYFIKNLPYKIRIFFRLLYPILDIITKIDNLNFVKNNKKLSMFHGGYFIIVKKQ